jgi:hypothetical protein
MTEKAIELDEHRDMAERGVGDTIGTAKGVFGMTS